MYFVPELNMMVATTIIVACALAADIITTRRWDGRSSSARQHRRALIRPRMQSTQGEKVVHSSVLVRRPSPPPGPSPSTSPRPGRRVRIPAIAVGGGPAPAAKRLPFTLTLTLSSFALATNCMLLFLCRVVEEVPLVRMLSAEGITIAMVGVVVTMLSVTVTVTMTKAMILAKAAPHAIHGVHQVRERSPQHLAAVLPPAPLPAAPAALGAAAVAGPVLADWAQGHRGRGQLRQSPAAFQLHLVGERAVLLASGCCSGCSCGAACFCFHLPDQE
jgi:hypothetical protein